MEIVHVADLRIGYRRVGSGPPLLLLHGYVGDGSTTWRPQLEGLADDFTVVAWDAPGSGGSSDPPETFGMAEYADCLAGFLDQLGLVRPHVAGLSFGGALALELSRRHPDLVRTLILVSAYAGWAGSLPVAVADERLRQAFVLADLSPDKLVAALLPTMFAGATSQETVEAFAESMLAFHPDGLRAMARALAEDLSEALPRVDMPTLVVHGEHDVRAPRPVAEHLHAGITGSKLIVLPDAGHLCNLEAPQQFNEAVRGFLRDRSS